MPYSKISELPDQAKVLPEEAQQQFLRVVNSSLGKGDSEETAFAKAWGAIKRKYEKNESDEWVAKMSDEPELMVEFGEAGEGGWRLYMPFRTIHHGIKKNFTINDGIEMVSNFKQHIPDYDLPINSLHRDEFGVFGTIADLQISERGVEWRPEFNDGAIEELVRKGYKYASPEVQFSGYVGVYDGREYNNVALGIAITPRPRLGRDTLVFSDGEWKEYSDEDGSFDEIKDLHRMAFEYPNFKQEVEKRIEEIEARLMESPSGEGEELSMEDEKKEGLTPNETPVEAAEAVDVRLAEKDAALTTLQEEKAKLEERTKALEMQLAEFAEARAKAEQVAMEELTARRRLEFAETARQFESVTEENFGDELMWLNDADQSDGKVHYGLFLRVLKALGNQEKTAALFAEAGHDGNAPSTVQKRFESLVKQAMDDNGITRAAAIEIVARENDGLYAEYDRAVTKTLSD